ncbi:sulfite exporter TauE/SafE family protein [Limosilactobacillus coleohominis]|uniref:sulfite exporter TauE/SafE family protein n=1 Tax=Limosilactobacillus coleohominis TaxID=181675 RepID=UPI001EF729A3|nr:sulfite exporter TauE/SafE family protein [Limosilactobacillus coleohominis]
MFNLHLIGIIIYVILGGIVAGVLSSAASFASLASYPLLLSLGIPPVYANVTNDAALIWNSLGAILSSGRELHGHWKQVSYYAIFTVVGSIIGCFLLLSFPAKVFEKVVPFFILLAGTMIIISGRKKALTQEIPSSWKKLFFMFMLILVGIYAGYFGAASGVVILVLLTYLNSSNFLVTNAIKNAVCGLTNLTALIIYSFTSHIYWLYANPLAIGMFIGGYLGPIIVRNVPEKAIRWVIAILSIIQAGIYFYQAYFV